jgi:hypothetical protein
MPLFRYNDHAQEALPAPRAGADVPKQSKTDADACGKDVNRE